MLRLCACGNDRLPPRVAGQSVIGHLFSHDKCCHTTNIQLMSFHVCLLANQVTVCQETIASANGYDSRGLCQLIAIFSVAASTSTAERAPFCKASLKSWCCNCCYVSFTLLPTPYSSSRSVLSFY